MITVVNAIRSRIEIDRKVLANTVGAGITAGVIVWQYPHIIAGVMSLWELVGVSMIGLLPLIAVVIFFFKRLSVNKLLKRVAVAAGSALGLVAVSAVFAAVFGA